MFSGTYAFFLGNLPFIFYVEVSGLSANKKGKIVSKVEDIFPFPRPFYPNSHPLSFRMLHLAQAYVFIDTRTLWGPMSHMTWSSWEVVSVAASLILSPTWYSNCLPDKLKNLWGSLPNLDLLPRLLCRLWPSALSITIHSLARTLPLCLLFLQNEIPSPPVLSNHPELLLMIMSVLSEILHKSKILIQYNEEPNCDLQKQKKLGRWLSLHMPACYSRTKEEKNQWVPGSMREPVLQNRVEK